MKKSVLYSAVISIILVVAYVFYLGFYTPASIPMEFFGGQQYDSFRAQASTADNGYLLAGMTTSYGIGSVDVYVVKLDKAGRLQWDTTFGGKDDDRGQAIAVNRDGSFAVAGSTTSYGAGGMDVLLVKADRQGRRVFIKSYGWEKEDNAEAMCATQDNGYLMAGATLYEQKPGVINQDMLLIKTDADGNCQWARSYGGRSAEAAHSVIKLENGNYAVAGETGSYGAGMQDAYVVIVDSAGNCINSRTYGYKSADRANGIIELGNRGFFITAELGTFETQGYGSSDMYFIRTDDNLKVVWQEVIGGISSDYAKSACEMPDGSIIAACVTASEGNGETDIKILKFSADGKLEWEKIFGGAFDEYVADIKPAGDSAFTLTGWSKSFGNGDYDGFFTKIKY